MRTPSRGSGSPRRTVTQDDEAARRAADRPTITQDDRASGYTYSPTRPTVTQADRESDRQAQLDAPMVRDRYSDAYDSYLTGWSGNPNADQSADFSPAAVADRERQRSADPYYFIRRMQEAAVSGVAAQGTSALSMSVPTALSKYANPQNVSLTKYPTLLAAASKSDLSDTDVKTLVNFTEAHRAALELSNTVDPERQVAIINSMSPMMQMATFDILQAAQDNKELLSTVQQEAPGFLDMMWQKGVVEPFNRSMDAMMVPNELSQHFVRAGQLARQDAFSTDVSEPWQNRLTGAVSMVQGGFVGSFNPVYWQATEKGSYDVKALDELRSKYGANNVNVLLRGQQLANDGEPDAVGRWMAEYANDPAALKVIDHVIFARDADTQLIDLANKIDSTHQGNLGFLLTNPVTPEGQRGSGLQQGVANAANIAAFFVLDPLIVGSKARSIYIGARYGLHMLSNASTIDKAFEMRQVRRFFDTLGSDFGKAQSAGSYGDQADRMGRVYKKYASWFKPDAINAMRDFGVKNADDALRFFKESDQAEALIRGQAVRRNPYVPHANWIANKRRQISGVGGVLPSARGASDVYGLTVGRAADPADRQAQAKQVADTLMGETNGVENAATIGAREGIVEPSSKVIRVTPKLMRVIPGTNGGYTYSAKKIVDRVDRFARKFARMPNGTGGIYVSDARDADRVYQYARAFLTRYHANLIRQAWIDAAGSAERYRIIQGLNRTAGYAKGIHLVDPRGIAKIDELSAGLRSGDQFAATQRGITGERLGQYVDPIDQSSARYSGGRSLKEGDEGRKRLISDLGWRMHDNIEQQEALKQTIKNTTNQIELENAKNLLFDLRRDHVKLSQLNRDLRRNTGALSQRLENDVRNALKPTSRMKDNAAKADLVDQQAKDAANDLRAVERKLSKAKKRGAGPAEIQRLKDLRDKLRTNRSALYFDNKRLAAERARIEQISPDDYVTFDPSNVRGQAYAIFPWQTSPRVAIPRWDQLESIRARTGLIDQVTGLTQSWFAQGLTDTWSFLTLAGPRFAMRNVLEDYIFYVLTRGNLPDMAGGRVFSTAVREARGVKQPRIRDARKGEPPLMSRGLGIVNRPKRKLGDAIGDAQTGIAQLPRQGVKGAWLDAQDAMYGWLSRAIVSNIDETRIAAAQKAMRRGDMSPMRDLVAHAWLRYNTHGTIKVGSQEDKWLMQMVSENGFRHIDHVGDVARHMFDGVLPGVGYSWSDTEGAAKMLIQPRAVGPYTSIGLDPAKVETYDYLYMQIENVLERSRSIGKIAVAQLAANLGKGGEAARADRAIKKIAEKVKTDPWYRENMAIFHEAGMTEEEYATRFYYAVRNLFSGGGPEGRLNEDLLRRVVVQKTDPATGQKIPSVQMWDKDPVTGKSKARVTTRDLLAMDRKFLPENVLGRERAAEVPLFTDLGRSDRIYSIMGEQNARLSREPMLIANYLHTRRQLAAAKYEERLVAEGMTEEKAAEQAARIAVDQAYERTMMFTDNPEVRSMLAWNVRNVARFYRATEDFYRRMVRLTKTNPEAIWKAALTYDVIGHSGFVHEDEYGDKYFVYPGFGTMFDAVSNTLGLTGVSQRGIGSPFLFGGKVNMLTPSLDPNAWLPTFTGPLVSFPLKAVLDMFPQAQGIERALLGTYATENPNVFGSLIPGPVQRALSAVAQDERQSQYASAYKSAIQIMTANGEAPLPLSMDDEELRRQSAGGKLPESYVSRQMKMNEYLDRVSHVATSILWARFVFGYFVPASPQILENDVTDYARRLGVSGARPAFIKLLNNSASMDEAMATWWRLNPNLMPYTLSKSEDGPNVTGASNLQPFNEVVDWSKRNEDLMRRFPDAATYLAPTDGTYSPSAMRWLQVNGYKQPKLNSDFAQQVLTQEGWYLYSQTRADYRERLAATTSKDEAKLLDEKMSSAKRRIFITHPGLDERAGGNGYLSNARAVADQMDAMLDYIYSPASSIKPTPAIENIAVMLATYKDAKAQYGMIVGSSKPADEKKRDIKMRLNSVLERVSASDPNAERFKSAIIDPLISGGELSAD